jgi:tetratricopeptide (TPR) repeat protein
MGSLATNAQRSVPQSQLLTTTWHAESLFSQGRYRESLEAAIPLLPDAVSQVEGRELLAIYARALVAQAKAPELRVKLLPLLETSVSARWAWQQAAIAIAGAGEADRLQAASAWLGELETFLPAKAMDDWASHLRAWCALPRGEGFPPVDSAVKRLKQRLTDMGRPSEAAAAAIGEAMGRDDPRQATDWLRSSARAYPESADIHLLLARQLVRRPADIDEAAAVADKARQLARNSADAHGVYAQALLGLGNREAGLAAGRLACRLDPRSTPWAVLLTRGLLQKKDPSGARAILQAHADSHPVRPVGQQGVWEDYLSLCKQLGVVVQGSTPATTRASIP